MSKDEIVEILEEIGVLLELKGENSFKVRAYQNGARALDTMEDRLEDRLEAGGLGKVKGIGEALAEKIETLYRTGELGYHRELKASVAPGLIEILEIPGLGGKKVKALHEALGIETIDALKSACEAGKVAELKGFGKKTEAKILSGIEHREAYAKRHLWWDAEARAREVLEGLRKLDTVGQAELAGSLRRLRETVGDLDFVVASSDPGPVMDWFAALDDIHEVTAKGETKTSVRFEGGLQADLRVVPAKQFAFALHHFTGSKEHNVAMRQRALKRGLSLSEWGLAKKDSKAIPEDAKEIGSEADLFAYFGLDAIPPELREGQGELEAAEKGELPDLVERDAIRGVFHNHTTASDGRATLEEMAAAAAEYGWDYLGIADHSKASVQAGGLKDDEVLEQAESIRALNAEGKGGIHLFAGIECDILKDGSLDLDDATLDALDYAVMSVHSSFGQSKADMTRRIVKAIEHPATTMLGHPTGRLLLRREPYEVDLEKVIDAAVANRVIVEINANPRRLDMDWRLWRQAAERGLMCAINPDAHRVEGLAHYRAGVNIARKGWLPAERILNTRDRRGVERWFAERK